MFLDYNDTTAQPPLSILGQTAVLPGSTLSGNVVPCTEYLLNTVISLITPSPTPEASSLEVSDNGNTSSSILGGLICGLSAH